MTNKSMCVCLMLVGFSIGFAVDSDSRTARACPSGLNEAGVAYGTEGAEAEGCCDEDMVDSWDPSVPGDWEIAATEAVNIGSFQFALAVLKVAEGPLDGVDCCTCAPCSTTIAAMSAIDGDDDEEHWFGTWESSGSSCDSIWSGDPHSVTL